jgi:hypothetical protein
MLTITSPATNRHLTTLDAAKIELGLSDTSQDSVLGTMIDQMSSLVETYCNRVFALETVSETMRLPQGRLDRPIPGVKLLQLERWPVVSVSSVYENGTLLDGLNWYVDLSLGHLFRLDDGKKICWTNEIITVAYQAGYVLPGDTGRNLPADIELATLELIRTRFLTKGRDPTIRSVNIPGVMQTDYWVGGMSDNGAIPPNVAGILDQYRVVGMS